MGTDGRDDDWTRGGGDGGVLVGLCVWRRLSGDGLRLLLLLPLPR